MPQAKTGRKTATRTATTRKKASARRAPVKAAAERRTATIDRTQDLTEETLKSLESAQRAAIEAVRKFSDTVDRAMPVGGDGPSRQQEVVDSALEMAERLVRTQYEFLQKVVDNAGKSLRPKA